VIGWELAAALWRLHLPDPLALRPVCRACGWYFPCPGWQFADSFLASALVPNPDQEEATRELPVVRPRLPRRQPGALLQEEARFDGWFTQPG
jgi:hypothetical protein